jgi:hypothetical protein
MPAEQLLDGADAAPGALVPIGAELTAVAIGVGDVVDVRQQRPEAGVLPGLAGGERHRPGAAPVERAAERDDRGAPGGVAGQLDGPFGGLGAGVGQEDPFARRPRRDAAQPLAEGGHRFEVEVRAADVEEPPGRVLHRLHHRRVVVPGRADRDPRHEVEEPVAVHVLDHRAPPAGDDERILLDVGVGRPGLVALDDGLGFRTWRRNYDLGIVAHGSPSWMVPARLFGRR